MARQRRFVADLSAFAQPCADTRTFFRWRPSLLRHTPAAIRARARVRVLLCFMLAVFSAVIFLVLWSAVFFRPPAAHP